MRKPIMAGNWKMNNNVAESKALAAGVKDGAGDVTAIDVVLCPPATAINAVADSVAGSNIEVGGQNMCAAESGAVTGEISILMLKEFCKYVILGHSERRQYFAESDKAVNMKARKALEHGLVPIICVGESLEQNEAGETVEFVGSQVRGALAEMSAAEAAQVVVAYEPIWAIGTGKAAEPAGVNDIIRRSIRDVIANMFDDATAQAVRVQYGGSVKPANVDAFMSQPDIDGALVGGASLKADSFQALVDSAVKHSA